MRPIKWIKTLARIVATYDKNRIDSRLREDSDKEYLASRIRECEQIIRDRTDIHVDLSVAGRNANQIVVIGHYRGCDYVQTYSMYNKDFTYVVEQLKEMSRYATVKRVDAVHGMEAVIAHELKKDGY